MRNLKKFLALVLAMVMAFSLMLSASAANFDDKNFGDTEDVTPAFVESVAVLTGLNVIKGDGDGEIKNIRPQSEITRAEAAALVYRIATGDINDKQVGLYADYSNFVDVKPRTADDEGDWFAGYVGYCQNAGIIKGKSATVFDPYGKVTGYEVLAMILRAVGYGKNGEFTGSNWQVNVASLAKTKHISDSVTSAAYNYTLNMNARREIVAELLFRGSLIPMVNWTPGLGYVEYDNSLKTNTNSLSWEVFRLDGRYWSNDGWGRPQFTWKASLNPSDANRTVATLSPKPVVSADDFHTTKRECDVAEMMDFGDSRDYNLWVDGDFVTGDYHVVATDTVTKVGGMGRKVEIYTLEDIEDQFPWHNTHNYWTNVDEDSTGIYDGNDIIVMIDTYLAKVATKTDCVKDPAGHVIKAARLVVDLYDGTNDTAVDKRNDPVRRIIENSGDKNWDEYAIGDVISLNATSDGLDKKIPVGTSDVEAWAFRLPAAATSTAANKANVLAKTANLTKLPAKPATQTRLMSNVNQHEVGGEVKDDDMAFRMDKAGNSLNTTFNWYYDEYGFLLGVDEGGSKFGVITDVYVSYGAETATDGVGKAMASVTYADGSKGTEAIDYFLVSGSAYATRGDLDKHITLNTTTGKYDNAAQLWPVYNVSNVDPMVEREYPYGSALPSPKRVADGSIGAIYMAPVAASNNQSAFGTNAAGNKVFGTLKNNLFKFMNSSNGMTVAVEVAGGNNSTNGNAYTDVIANIDDDTKPIYSQKSGNTGDFEGLWTAKNDITGSTKVGKLYKNLGYVQIVDGNDAYDTITWLNNATQILFRDETTGSIVPYTLATLPGDITISTITGPRDTTDVWAYNEVDWADLDSDGRADVIYLTGKLQGVTTYGLFYSNGMPGSWDGSVGKIHGFLNGEETDLVFSDWDNYNTINSASTYRGHLFAVKQFNNVVTNVMLADDNSTGKVNMIPNSGDKVTKFNDATTGDGSATVAKGIYVDGSAPVDAFHYGNDLTDAAYLGTNPYNDNTEAVYYSDDTVTPVKYNPSANWTLLGATVTVGGVNETYHLTPNSKVYGMGNGVILAEGLTALEYLNHSYTNDVTIIYEAGTLAVLEMYIQTDPNITPNNPNGPIGSNATPNAKMAGVYDPIVPTGTPTGGWLQKNQTIDSFVKGLPAGVVYTSTYFTGGGGMCYNGDGGSVDLAIRFDLTNPVSLVTYTGHIGYTITDAANGAVVSSGTMGGVTASPLASTQHYLYFNPTSSAGGLNLTSGHTYKWQFTTNDLNNPIVVGASGSFTYVP